MNVPIGIATYLFGLFFLQEHREPTAGHFDLPGFLLAGIGLVLTLYALSEGPASGWTSPDILVSALGDLLLLAAKELAGERRHSSFLVRQVAGAAQPLQSLGN